MSPRAGIVEDKLAVQAWHKKKPGPRGGGPGFGKWVYLVAIGAGAGGAGGFGQQEAASTETAAAAMRNLTDFMLFCQLLVVCLLASNAG